MVTILEIGAFRVTCMYITPKGNRWYYRRRIPAHARHLSYGSRSNKSRTELYFSLRTSDKTEAARLADIETRKFDALWRTRNDKGAIPVDPYVSIATLESAGLRPGDGVQYPDHPAIDDFRDRLVGLREEDDPPLSVSAQDRLTLDILNGAPIPRTLEDARRKHFGLGKRPRNKIAEGQFNRAWALLLDITGDITLENLRREHANEFVRKLVGQGVGAETIKRYLSQVRPVIATGIREFELKINNPFEGIVIPNKDEGQRRPRQTYDHRQLQALQKRCWEVNDQRRWAILMLSDSMSRLAEVAGLRKEDVFLDVPVPYMQLRNTEERRLKTKQSERLVPLVGEALRAAKLAMKTPGPFLFPVFFPKDAKKQLNANSASAALNKWLKENKLCQTGQDLHSLRHTMRDRLREVLAPSDLIDEIGGWKTSGVGQRYGQGYSLAKKAEFMTDAVKRDHIT